MSSDTGPKNINWIEAFQFYCETSDGKLPSYQNVAGYLMEHLEDLLICEGKAYQQEKVFELLFEEFPTYEELLNGTPKLSPIFALNTKTSLSKSDLVTLLGVEPRLQG